MKKILFILLLFCGNKLIAQPIEVDVFQKASTATTITFGIRAKATGIPIPYTAVTFYTLYQSSKLEAQTPNFNTQIGIDDSKMTTEFNWGIGNRFNNGNQVINLDPSLTGGVAYDRRFVYGNGDENYPTNTQNLISTRWDTLVYFTLNIIGTSYPEGGLIRCQATTEAPGAAMTDLDFANIPFLVNSGNVPLTNSVVPVLFSQFEARCNDLGSLLTWTTAQESNSNYFEIEKSLNGVTWTALGRTNAAGNSSINKNYQYTDANGGAAFYRIKQVDNDGATFYTSIKATNCNSKTITNVIYPVPAKDILYVSIKSDKALKTNLQVYDATGKIVRSMEAMVNKGNNNFTLNLKGLASGDYIIKSTEPEINLTKRFIINN